MSLFDFDKFFFGKTADDYYWEGYNDVKEGNISLFSELTSSICLVPQSENTQAYNAGVRDAYEEE
jgi:hypothetical protein